MTENETTYISLQKIADDLRKMGYTVGINYISSRAKKGLIYGALQPAQKGLWIISKENAENFKEWYIKNKRDYGGA